MAKYNVTLEKTIRTCIEVEADSPDNIQKAMGDYENIFTEAGNVVDVEYDWAACDADGCLVIDWD